MIRFLKQIAPNPLHSFLLPVFFIVHNLFDFYGLVDPRKLWIHFILWLLLPAISLFFSKILLKQKNKAGLFSFLLLVQYFFAVAIHQLLIQLPVIGPLFSWPVFLVMLLALTLFCFLLLKRNRWIPTMKLHRLLLIVVLCFIVIDAVQLLFRLPGKNQKQNSFIQSNIPLLNKPVLDTSVKPDIYYFLFDMHGSTQAIREQFQYDNDILDSTLQKFDFVFPDAPVSTSNYTLITMASIFNMAQVPLQQKTNINFHEMYKARMSIERNVVVPFLLSNGYDIINASTFPIYSSDTSTIPYAAWSAPEELITNQTLPSHLYQVYNWALPSFFKNLDHELYKSDLQATATSLQRVEQTIADTGSTRPRFCYTHLYLPHEPFKFDSTGKQIDYIGPDERSESFTQLYINQLVYCRKLIVSLAQKIKVQSRRPVIIIFQGDHGARELEDVSPRVFSVLNAVYLPGDNQGIPKELAYTTNTFRYIFNRYFHQQLPLLKPETHFIQIK
ncbi:MAG: sulfatase-like hydrolase/transferase [Chitinophagaceae bacterium]